MSRLIPIRLAELAVEAKELQVKFLTDENKRVQDMLKTERENVQSLLNNNYRLRNAVLTAIDLMDNTRSFTEDERLSLMNSIRGSLV